MPLIWVMMPMRRRKLALYLSMTCLASAPQLTSAQSKFSASLRLTSNYVYRDYSKSNGDPALQGNLDYEHSSGFFAGSWVSQVDFDDPHSSNGAQIEVYPYAGLSVAPFDPWRMEFTLAGYIYDGKVLGDSYDYAEFYTLLHYSDLVTTRLGVALDAYGGGKSVPSYEVSTRYPISDTVDVAGAVGYEGAYAAFEPDHVYWNLGVSWFPNEWSSVDLRYYDARALGNTSQTLPGKELMLPGIDNHLVVSFSVGF